MLLTSIEGARQGSVMFGICSAVTSIVPPNLSWAEFSPMVLQVAVFLPQLVQLLRGDSDRSIASFLIQGARKSSYFANILLYILTVCSSEPPTHQSPTLQLLLHFIYQLLHQ